MIAIYATFHPDQGGLSNNELAPLINDRHVDFIEFFNSCVVDGLILNTVRFRPIDDDTIFHLPVFYSIDETKAAEFQERFMSDTASFSIKQFWVANGFRVGGITQTSIVFEDVPTDELVELVDIEHTQMYGTSWPIL